MAQQVLSLGTLIFTWSVVAFVWWQLTKSKRRLRVVLPGHKVYDLVAHNDNRVTVLCADCWKPLGTTLIAGWGAIAEEHYREEEIKRGRP